VQPEENPALAAIDAFVTTSAKLYLLLLIKGCKWRSLGIFYEKFLLLLGSLLSPPITVCRLKKYPAPSKQTNKQPTPNSKFQTKPNAMNMLCVMDNFVS